MYMEKVYFIERINSNYLLFPENSNHSQGTVDIKYHTCRLGHVEEGIPSTAPTN